MPATLSNFEGVGKGMVGYTISGDPPDTNGDIGINHYIQTVNSSFAIFNRSGTVLYGPSNINTLWSGFGGSCQTDNDGDPVVKYDKRADRWVISQFAVASGGSTGPFYQCVAVSTTSDPLGTYYRYAFSFANFNDYPKLGIWPDAYYFTFNMFTGPGAWVGGEVCALNRTAMLAGSAATMQCFGPYANYGSMLPSDLDGRTDPPSGSPNYLLALDNNPLLLDFWKLHIDWAVPANSTLTGPTQIAIPTYTGLLSVAQQGSAKRLDGLGDRLMYRLAYRNMGSYESLVVNHSVDAAGTTGLGTAGIRWYEVRSPATTPTLYQKGTFAPDSMSRWMGSMAMDASGNIAVGYSISSATSFPSINFTGRLAADPLNTLPQGETVMVAGTGANNPSYAGDARWGDYSSISVDPTDDCTFWYTNEYFSTTAAFNWRTRIGSFKFPSCVTPPTHGSGDITPMLFLLLFD
jgi:hypothetical protein